MKRAIDIMYFFSLSMQISLPGKLHSIKEIDENDECMKVTHAEDGDKLFSRFK
jgi:hypothetical protein